MSFTRFHDDPARIMKQNQQSTDPGRWVLNKPGNGATPYYMEDPQIIPQQWAGNLWSHSTDLQSALLGLDRGLNKDCLGINEYTNSRFTKNSQPIKYPNCSKLTTEQSRAVLPAWTTRDLEQVNWQPLLSNPQEHVFPTFTNNVSSRILEKDNFIRTNDCDWSRQLVSLPPLKPKPNIKS